MPTTVTLRRSEVYQILLALAHRDTQRIADAVAMLQDKLRESH